MRCCVSIYDTAYPTLQPLQPLRENLIITGFYSDSDSELQLVPEGVLLQHYMHFVVLLRK